MRFEDNTFYFENPRENVLLRVNRTLPGYSIGEVSHLSNLVNAAMQELLARDITEFPAGAARSQAAEQTQADLRIVSAMRNIIAEHAFFDVELDPIQFRDR